MKARSALALALCCGSASVVSAQPIMWAAAGSGAWGAALNWSPANIPDNPGEDAILGGVIAYSVSLNGPAISPSIGSLAVTNPLAELVIDAGRSLTINTASTNNGLITINPTAAFATTTLAVGGPVTLGGTGQVQMRSGGSLSSISGPGVLSHGAGHTIRGVGQISVHSNNSG